MTSDKKWMIYGANGYTGELIAREAKKRFLTPILAGRNKKAIPTLANELELDFRIFDLSKSSVVLDHLADVDFVLNCAGPFAETYAPLVEACLASKTHYFDITGEIDVFEAIRKQDYAARQREVMLMPGIGFDVVPTDCLALHLVNQLPSANTLILAIDFQGHPSQGTAKTMIAGLQNGGRVRELGNIKRVSLVYKTRRVPFPHGEKLCVTIPWGDVSTAYYTTGIPNIEVYSAQSRKQINQLKWLNILKPLAKSNAFRKSMFARLTNNQKGPDEEERASSQCIIWGQVRSRRGKTREAYLITPNGYDVTVQTALKIVSYFLNHKIRRGVHTPAKLLGENLITQIPGVELHDEAVETNEQV